MSAKLSNLVGSPSPLRPSELSPQTVDPGITTAEAARALGFSSAALKKWRAEGNGPPYLRIGRSIRYRLSDLRTWQQSHVVETTVIEVVKHD